MIIDIIIGIINNMIYMFNVSKDDGFCTVIGEIINSFSIKILELIECDDVNLWCQTVRKLHKNYNIIHHYYLGSDEYFSILKLICPELKKQIYRKEWEELNLDKLLKKLTDKIELPLEWEHLKGFIFDKDIKIDCLKFVASVNCFWVDDKREENGIFSYYERKKEESKKPYIPFEDISLERVLRYFD